MSKTNLKRLDDATTTGHTALTPSHSSVYHFSSPVLGDIAGREFGSPGLSVGLDPTLTPEAGSLAHVVIYGTPDELTVAVKAAMDMGVSVDVEDERDETCGWTALWWAVKYRKRAQATILRDAGADLSKVVYDGPECIGNVHDLIALRASDSDHEFWLDFSKSRLQGGRVSPIRTRMRGAPMPFSFASHARQAREGIGATEHEASEARREVQRQAQGNTLAPTTPTPSTDPTSLKSISDAVAVPAKAPKTKSKRLPASSKPSSKRDGAID